MAVAQPAPAWVAGRTWYHLHALRAAGCTDTNTGVAGTTPTGHGLRELEAWLDHIAALGCGGVVLTPIAVSSTHGYDTVDPFRVDPRLGNDDDFSAFVTAAHERDLKLVLDGVFNHVGRAFPRFADVLEHKEASPNGDWFRIDFTRDDGDGFAYQTFEGHRELVALNHRNPEVLDWAVGVAMHWLERGADGWRLDAAYAIAPAFIAAFAERVRAERPDAFLFGEMIHGDYAGFVGRTGLHSVTQYELYKAIWSSLNDANFFELKWALERHAAFARTFAPVTFAGNHDVTRLASILDDAGQTGHALALLLTLPGIPCVYYGDECGAPGVKRTGVHADDEIRPALASLDCDGEHAAELRKLHRELIAFRRERPWLTTAECSVEHVANRSLLFSVRDGDRALLVALALEGAAPAPVDCTAWTAIAGTAPDAAGQLLPGTWTIFEHH
jgi:cyclomaltodextrinase / maltogenic alpha-amylase / neopullulanase